MGVAAIYEGWERIQTRLTNRLPRLEPEHLQLRGVTGGWPIWALVSHMAAVRVYWLCAVCGEPGAEATPFPDPQGEGWEDHLDVPRRSDELMWAIQSSWVIVESCLERTTPEMLSDVFSRWRDGVIQRRTRQSVLTQLVMHDTFHIGEVSVVLGMHGLAGLDPWEPISA
jgi:uncharacterized damage-inducible protein DinB